MKLMKVKVLIEVLIGLAEQRCLFLLHFLMCFVPRWTHHLPKLHTKKSTQILTPIAHSTLFCTCMPSSNTLKTWKLRFSPCGSVFSAPTMMVQAPKHRSPLRFLQRNTHWSQHAPYRGLRFPMAVGGEFPPNPQRLGWIGAMKGDFLCWGGHKHRNQLSTWNSL